MPIVPTQDNFQTQVAGQPNVRFNAPDMPDYAGYQTRQLGQGLSAAGQALGRIAIEAQHEGNLTVSKDIDNQMTAATSDALYHPEKGFMSKLGKDTIDGYDAAVQNVKKIRQDALDGIKNPAVRKMVEPVLNQRIQHAVETIDRHSGQESRRYQVQTADSRAQINLQDAAQNYTDDGQFNQALGIARGEAQSLAKLQGLDPDAARLQASKYQDLGYKMRYSAWAGKDPAAAFAHFQQNAEQISPLARDQLGHHLFQLAAPVLADQFNKAGGVGVLSSTPSVNAAANTTTASDGTLPRGIRNNNPGNISKGTDAWQGEVTGNDPRYVSFATPEAGIRAMGKTLLNYQDKYDLNTVEGIIARWAPATENNTVSYSATVAKALGVKVDAPIDLHDTDTLNKITRAMIQVENGPGASRITDQQLTLGLAAANGGAALPPAAAAQSEAVGTPGTSVTTGSKMLDSLPDNWKIHVLQLAKTQANQGMAEARETLRGKVQDSTSAYLANGFAPNPPAEAEFIKAYGQAEGLGRFRDFQNVASLGQTLQTVKTLPSLALTNLVESSKPTPGDGFAVRQHSYESLVSAVDQVQKARAKDPVAYALSIKSYGITPIERFDDPKTLVPELARRAAAAKQMATDYSTEPQLLTKDETRLVGAMIKAAPVESQKSQLATIYQGIGDMDLFKRTMQTLAPDNPTMAVAGIYQARGLRTTENRDVADLILRGQAILTPNTQEDGTGHMGGKALLKMPEGKLLLSDWNSVTDGAFKGKEQAADLFMQTSKAIYAARSAEDGDYSGVINSGRWNAAINLATGGIQSHNGTNIVMPYGLGYDQFQNTLKVKTEQIVKDGGAFNTNSSEMMRLPLENVGDGRYLFRRGAGYLVNKDGRPVVVNVGGDK